METLYELVRDYGYLAIVIQTFIEGETSLILGGVFAQQGTLWLPYVMLAALAGSFAGDQIWFFLGRRYGARVLDRLPRIKAKADKAMAMFERYQDLWILSFRFFYGLRNPTPFVIGMSRISTSRFVILNFISAVIWAIGYGALGYVIGHAITALIDHIHYLLLGALAVVALGIWLVVHYRRRRAQSVKA